MLSQAAIKLKEDHAGQRWPSLDQRRPASHTNHSHYQPSSIILNVKMPTNAAPSCYLRSGRGRCGLPAEATRLLLMQSTPTIFEPQTGEAAGTPIGSDEKINSGIIIMSLVSPWSVMPCFRTIKGAAGPLMRLACIMFCLLGRINDKEKGPLETNGYLHIRLRFSAACCRCLSKQLRRDDSQFGLISP